MMSESPNRSTLPPPPTTSWSSLLKEAAQPPTEEAVLPSHQVFDGCKSSKGVAVAVVDANAIIQGGESLNSCADRFVSVTEVINEVRDPTSRHRLSVLPFTVDTTEPSPESLKKVVSFARETGDLQTLSDVDLKLIALTYTLEAQIHGTKHVRDRPPPVHLLNVRRLPEKDMPGWGSNVPNLEEWEALEGLTESVSHQDSKILPLKDLSLNVQCEDNLRLQDGSMGSVDENNTVDGNHSEQNTGRSRRYPIKKRELKIEGKKMVADGIDASQGQFDDNAGDWNPAVSRSTRRRYLRRKARREMYGNSLKDDEPIDAEEEMETAITEEPGSHKLSSEEKPGRTIEMNGQEISSIMEQMSLEGGSLRTPEEEALTGSHPSLDASIDVDATVADGSCFDGEDNDCGVYSKGSEHFETLSQATESADTYVDDHSSEQSWALRSLSESSVACVTGDFAMQNVILQMGLRLLAPGGMQIRELRRWVLKCHACHKVTNEIGRIFCPKCGNGGTLRKVAVTVGENGVVLAARRPRVSLRGTRFSLPLPQGGRDAITKNPILSEDQLPHKFGTFLRDDNLLRSKPKNKSNNKGMDFFASDDIFSCRDDKKEPLKPPVRQALNMLWGKRNPNDNHYSRAKH